MKVHVGGTPEVLELATPAAPDDGTYEGGHVSHTGQIYFEDTTSDEVYDAVEAYAGRDNAQRLRNDQDGILGEHADEPGFIVSLSPLGEDVLSTASSARSRSGSIRPPRRNRPDSGADLLLGRADHRREDQVALRPMNLRQTLHHLPRMPRRAPELVNRGDHGKEEALDQGQCTR